MASETGEGFEPTMDDARIRAATGQGREHWFAALDAAGAQGLAHREIAAALVDEHGLPGWWAQTVAVEYERARGMRAKHQAPDGYAVSKSKTVRAPIADVHRAWADRAARESWLVESLELTSATAPRSVNGRWGGGGRLSVWLTAKGEDRTQVTVSHERLPGPDAAEREKRAWGERLARLAEAVDTP